MSGPGTHLPRALCAAAALTLVPMLTVAQGTAGDETVAPSGLAVALEEVIIEEDPYGGDLLVVVRLLVPTIASGIADAAALRADMDWACATWGVPAAASLATAPDTVVVEMMSAPVQRGEPDPAVTQVFEQYSLSGDTCIWELF